MNSEEQIKGQVLFNRQQHNKLMNGPVIICDGLQTPENFGAILRVADAAGSQQVILLDSELDLKNKKLQKISRSANRHLLTEHYSLQQLIANKHHFKTLYALEVTSHSSNIYSVSLQDCDALVLGHEASGIRAEVLALCDKAVHLPMYGTNGSMNVSHALAVFLYEWRRQTGAE